LEHINKNEDSLNGKFIRGRFDKSEKVGSRRDNDQKSKQ
jgi:hypothetical protein